MFDFSFGGLSLHLVVFRWKRSASYFRRMMKKNPPGTLGTGRPVTLVVTDIEVLEALRT